MSTHLDGAPPSMADPDDEDPDDGDRDGHPSEFDDGSRWVRLEIERRMAENRSTRGRHARRGDAAAGPPERHARDVGVPDTRPEPAPPRPPHVAVPLPPPGFAAGDLPENYVPRHSVQTPGPAAEPAEPVSGPIPIVRRAPADDTSGTPLGGPSLPPTGIPLPVRKKRTGPGTPLQVDGAATGPWSRPPTSIVPSEPVQRLGAPPSRLGAREPLPPWGVPASPPRGFPATRDAHPAVGGAEAVETAVPDTEGTGTGDDELVAGDTVPTVQVADDATDVDAPVVDPPAAPVAAGGAASTPGTSAPAPSAGAPPDERDLAEATTATLPVVGDGASRPARLVGIPVQRASGHRSVVPRPVTPRHIPVVGTAPPEPGSTRVRVVLSERKGVARPVRTIKEVQEGTAVGDLLRRDLIRSQLKVTLRFALITVFVLGSLPAVLVLLPELGRLHVLGLRVPWLLLGLLVYPFLVGVAWRYTWVSDRVEQNFADHVQD